jgi:hypothetical protein
MSAVVWLVVLIVGVGIRGRSANLTEWDRIRSDSMGWFISIVRFVFVQHPANPRRRPKKKSKNHAQNANPPSSCRLSLVRRSSKPDQKTETQATATAAEFAGGDDETRNPPDDPQPRSKTATAG